MARPRKQNAEYFSHDNDMRNDDKIKVIRAQFGHAGYAVYNMLLEVLTEANNFTLILDELTFDLMAADFGIDVDVLDKMIDRFRFLKLIIIENDRLFSPGLIKRMQPLLAIRATKRQWAQQNLGFANSNTTNSTSKTPQRKDKVNVSEDTNGKKPTTRKKAVVTIEKIAFPEHLNTPAFKNEFAKLLECTKWRRKSQPQVQKNIEQLARYDETFATWLVERSFAGNWQGVIFDNTDDQYKAYLQRQSGLSPGPAQQKNSRATLNNLNRKDQDEEQLF